MTKELYNLQKKLEFNITTGSNILNNQVIIKFKNGYGASIVQGAHTYGGSEGLYELAVITFTQNGFSICYDTNITGDVLGWLKPCDVISALEKINSLETKGIL